MTDPEKGAPVRTVSPGDGHLEAQILAEQVRLLYARAFAAQTTVIVIGSLVVYVFWGLVPRAVSLAWLGVLGLSAGFRFVLSRIWSRRPRPPEEAGRWARWFSAGSLVTGLAWGASAFLFYLPDSPVHQLFITFVLAGMSGGAASSSATYPSALIAFSVPALLPMVARLAVQGDAIHLAMGFLLAVFGAMVAAISRVGARSLVESIRLRFQNEALVQQLRTKEGALGTQQQFLRQVIDADPNLVFVKDWDGRFTLVNRAVAEIYGTTPEDLIGKTDADFNPDRAQVERFVRDDQDVMSSRTTKFIPEEPVLSPEAGESRWFQTIKVPLLSPNGLSSQVLGVSTDITERRRTELTQAAAYRISEAANTAGELPQLFRAIHDVVTDLMPAENLYIAVNDPATGMLSFPYFADQHDPPPEPRRMGKGMTEYVLRTGRSLLAPAEVFDALVARGEVDLVGARSIDWLGVPLKTQGRTIGAIVVQSYTQGVRFGETERRILEMVSEQVAIAVERKRAQETLRQREEWFRALIENNGDAITAFGPDGRIVYASPTASRILGYPNEESLGRAIYGIVHPEEVSQVKSQFEKLIQSPTGAVAAVQTRLRHQDGSWRMIEATFSNQLGNPSIKAVINNYRDVTERRRLESQLQLAQRMEAVGRLAGGIAHDFNNLLTVILASTDLLLQDFPADDPRRRDVAEIGRAAERAAALTRQLLAYSRKQVLQPAVVDLNLIVENMKQLLGRLIGEHIELQTMLADGLAALRADLGQLEQVIANLAVNARDAMTRGGRLTIETSNVEPGEASVHEHVTMAPGHYVLLTVSDTGTGMDAETLARCFEPFFTTKAVGEGTGLGLATTYGIVKQSGGFIWVNSEPGHGTSFKIYFPQVAEKPETTGQKPAVVRPAPGGSETILLVEDEGVVRDVSQRALEGLGYTVLAAESGEKALSLIASHAGPIDLLVTDVVMPRMDGYELAQRVAVLRPGTRVLYVSGYMDKEVVMRGVSRTSLSLLQKPFTIDALAVRVREVLSAA